MNDILAVIAVFCWLSLVARCVIGWFMWAALENINDSQSETIGQLTKLVEAETSKATIRKNGRELITERLKIHAERLAAEARAKAK